MVAVQHVEEVANGGRGKKRVEGGDVVNSVETSKHLYVLQ